MHEVMPSAKIPVWQGNCVYLRWTLYIQSHDALKIMLTSHSVWQIFVLYSSYFSWIFCWCWENRIKQWQKKIKIYFLCCICSLFPHKWWNSVPIKKSDSAVKISIFCHLANVPLDGFPFLSCSCNDPALYKTSIVLLSPVTDQHVMFAFLYIS